MHISNILRLGGGVPLRYDGAKQPAVGESLARGRYNFLLYTTRNYSEILIYPVIRL